MDAGVARECQDRGITRVCHFTQSRKLAHILSDPAGIRCVADIAEKSADTLNQNDPQRYDGRLDCINCSIEYPNFWLLRKVKERETVFRDWVVLLIDAKVLWRPGTVFAPRNAAACVGQHAGGVIGLRALYAPSITGAYGKEFRRSSKMLSCCPTDDQAEVLVPGNIARDLIHAVAVVSEDQGATEAARLGLLPDVTAVSWRVAPALFKGGWSALVRAGKRPTEEVYVPPSNRGARAGNA